MNTGNRVLWIAILGAVLTAAGVLGILANQGALAGVESTDRLADGDLVSRWHSWGGLATGIAIAAGLLVALLGFLLLRAQLRGRGGASLPDLSMSATPTAPPASGPGPVAAAHPHQTTRPGRRRTTSSAVPTWAPVR